MTQIPCHLFGAVPLLHVFPFPQVTGKFLPLLPPPPLPSLAPSPLTRVPLSHVPSLPTFLSLFSLHTFPLSVRSPHSPSFLIPLPALPFPLFSLGLFPSLSPSCLHPLTFFFFLTWFSILVFVFEFSCVLFGLYFPVAKFIHLFINGYMLLGFRSQTFQPLTHLTPETFPITDMSKRVLNGMCAAVLRFFFFSHSY